MKLKMENAEGKSYDVFQRNSDTFLVSIDGHEFKISVIEEPEESNENKYQNETDAIFKNKSVLEQLEASSFESDEDLITNKEDFMRIINEVQNA